MALAPVKKEPSANDWLNLMQKTGRGTPDIVPEGYESAVTLSKKTGKSVTRISELMVIAVQEGTVECKLFKPAGASRPIKHFKMLHAISENHPTD